MPGAFHRLKKSISSDIPVNVRDVSALGSFELIISRIPQNRRFPRSVHNSNPASRSPLTLNSRILTFKKVQTPDPENLLGTLLYTLNENNNIANIDYFKLVQFPALVYFKFSSLNALLEHLCITQCQFLAFVYLYVGS